MKQLKKVKLENAIILSENDMMSIQGGSTCHYYCHSGGEEGVISSCYSTDNPCGSGNWSCYCY